MVLSLPTPVNNSSLQTFSDQKLFKTFLQSHVSQLSSLRRSPSFNFHDSASYRRVLQITVSIILFFRQYRFILETLYATRWTENWIFVWKHILKPPKATHICTFTHYPFLFKTFFVILFLFVCWLVGLLALEAGINKSVIVGNNSEYLAYLNNWIKPTRSDSDWKLCWRASRNGWDSSRFHSLCDEKGPTITLIKVGKYIFGGYTSLSWSEYGSVLSFKSLVVCSKQVCRIITNAD